MPQIYNMGPTALLTMRRKACWGFFRPEKSWWLRPGLNLRTWVLKSSTLLLDHRSRIGLNVTLTKLPSCLLLSIYITSEYFQTYTDLWMLSVS